jgi:hypothetical protein
LTAFRAEEDSLVPGPKPTEILEVASLVDVSPGIDFRRCATAAAALNL